MHELKRPTRETPGIGMDGQAAKGDDGSWPTEMPRTKLGTKKGGRGRALRMHPDAKGRGGEEIKRTCRCSRLVERSFLHSYAWKCEPPTAIFRPLCSYEGPHPQSWRARNKPRSVSAMEPFPCARKNNFNFRIRLKTKDGPQFETLVREKMTLPHVLPLSNTKFEPCPAANQTTQSKRIGQP